MSKYATAYEWWLGEHKEMLSWVLDDETQITIGDILETLRKSTKPLYNTYGLPNHITHYRIDIPKKVRG